MTVNGRQVDSSNKPIHSSETSYVSPHKETKETIDFDLEDTPKGPEEFIKEMTEDGYTCK